MIVNKYIEKTEKNVRVPLTVPESIAEAIEHYAYYIEEQTGQSMSRKEVGVLMLRFFFDQDKKFKKWHNKNRELLRQGVTDTKKRQQLLAQEDEESSPESKSPTKHEAATKPEARTSDLSASADMAEDSQEAIPGHGDGGPQRPATAAKQSTSPDSSLEPSDHDGEGEKKPVTEQPKGEKIGGIISTGPKARVKTQETTPFSN